MKKFFLVLTVLVLIIAQGCAIAYIDETKTSTLTETEFGVLGFIPLWHSRTVHDPKQPIEAQDSHQLYLSKEGGLTLNTKKVAVEDLLSEMKAKGIKPTDTIILQADPNTRHDSVVKVLDQLAKGGYSRISFITK